MSQQLAYQHECLHAPAGESMPARDESGYSHWVFGLATAVLAVSAALLAGWAPIGFSIATVFLFAGPHNWMEGRYFLTRLPARWGKLRAFFGLALAGIFGLTAYYAALGCIAWGWSETGWRIALSIWNTLLVFWILALVQMRSRQNPRRDWSWTWPVGLFVVGLAWLQPEGWALSLVFIHPLMALWILDRELRRSRPEWLKSYRLCLLGLPILLGLLWWRLADAPPLPGNDAFTSRITQHAGADLLPGISSHLLVSTHTFLEMLHYGVWLLAIPMVALSAAPLRVSAIPLARRSQLWKRLVVGFFVAGAAAVVLLWCAFLADYPMTRDIYFTVAMLHVLAEAPFLLRAL